MSDDLELDKLIILNLDDIDATAKRIVDIERKVWVRIAERMKAWAKQVGWVGQYEFEDENLWVAPRDWYEGQEEPWAWFEVDWGPGDTGDGTQSEAYFHLSRLAGAAGGKMCLWLRFDGIRRSSWRRAFRSAVERGGTAGFVFDEKDGLYIDCTPPLMSLAEAVVEDDYERALARLERALSAAYEGRRTLDKILREARS